MCIVPDDFLRVSAKTKFFSFFGRHNTVESTTYDIYRCSGSGILIGQGSGEGEAKVRLDRELSISISRVLERSKPGG